jgi:hypothetical protein
MSIKSFFGKGLASLLEAHQDRTNRTLAGAQMRESTDMERMFGNCSPAVVAFRINNGFVVRTMNQEDAYVGSRTGGFTYCKDHAEIAEHIVASEVKRKLNIGEEYQQEMFAAEKARAVAMQGSGQFAQVKRATNRI